MTMITFTDPDPIVGKKGLDMGNGIFYRSDGARKLTLVGITDGTSNTLMIGESSHTFDQHCGGWAMYNYVNGTCAIPLNNLDPDKVVATGAAIQANVLAGNRSEDDWLLLDVIPLSLGIETMGGLTEKIIPRNSTLPIARAQEFTTYKDGQTAMAIHVVQGERELVSDCRSLARFELRGIPPLVAGAARIRVTFQVDADGLLSVAAREASQGVEAHVVVKPSYGLADDDIARMLQDSFTHASDDMQARALREQQVEGQQMLAAVNHALEADADLVDGREREEIAQAIADLTQQLRGSDHRAIKQAIEKLNRATEPFAARRMDKSVAKALTGHKLSEIQ